MNNNNQSGPPPHVALMQIVQGFMFSKALQVAAEIGIADLLAKSDRTAEELAQETSTNPSAMFRLLRALASRGIFRQNEFGCFENTPLSEPMRSDSPVSVRDYIIYAPHDGNMLAWMHLMSVLKTGEPSFEDANGCDMWEYFQQHPDIGERFNRAMTSLAAGNNRMILEHYDFSPFNAIIDIGGGQGLLLASILKAHSHMRGTLFDIPSVSEGAMKYLASQVIGDRYKFIAGDAFKSIPAGFDGYVMKNVLHDWSDEQCVELLKQCRLSIPRHGKLIIIDAVMLPGNNPHPSKWFDMHMMVALGGRERTEEEFSNLLSDTGFKLTMAKSLPAPIGIIEAIPI